MPRYSFRLQIACLAALVTLTGCTRHAIDNNDQANRAAAENYYDSYYGQPPSQAHPQQTANANTGSKVNGVLSAKGTGMVVNPSAPKTYTVKKGDTLWGIARKYLNTPSYWPEIWHNNQRLANPHLIYPGDVLHFGYHPQANSMKLMPRVRVERRGHGEPLATLAPFLAWPRVLDDATIQHSPYLLASRDNHTLITEGEKVYIKNLKNAAQGARYAVYHPKKPLKDPDSGELLGHQVDYVGYAKIDHADHHLTTATVLDAHDAIRRGDRLFKPENHEQTLRAPIHVPQHKVRGRIISLYHAKYLGSDCMIVVLNKGRRDKMKPGHTLGIYTDGRVVTDINRPKQGKLLNQRAQQTQLPPEKVAETVIYSVGEKFSYGLILNSEREVKNGDRIGNP